MYLWRGGKKKGVPAVNLHGIYPIWSSGMKRIENFIFVMVTLIHPSAFTIKVGTFHDGHEHFPACFHTDASKTILGGRF
jgi:hypothetical protein